MADASLCTTPTKTRYPTLEHAENAMRRTWRKPGAGNRPIRAYQCDCGWWHLTKKPLNVSADAQRERRAA